MHEDRAVIHGIAGGVLRVAQHRDARAVQICAQRVSGRACQRQLFLSKWPCRNIALAVHMLHGQRRVRAFPDARAKLLCWHVFRVKLCHHTSPPSCTLRSFWENAMSCGDSRIMVKVDLRQRLFLADEVCINTGAGYIPHHDNALENAVCRDKAFVAAVPLHREALALITARRNHVQAEHARSVEGNPAC